MLLTFDLAKTTIQDFRQKIEANDRKYGSHSMSWDGQICRVGWADHKEVRMGKLSEIGQRMAKAKAMVAAEADKLAAKIDAFEHKVPETFANANKILDQHSADIDAMDSELRQLTNDIGA